MLRMILAESGFLLACGLLVGLALAAAATRATAGLLYGVTPLDPISFALGTAVLGSVGVLAAWLPARRASRIQPIVALRE
jgi:ABC-type antimicrobial peptide transport system permease subunit